MQLLDSSHIVSTPEGVEIEFHIAGTVIRAVAWAVDFAIRCILFLSIAFLAGQISDGLASGLMAILLFLLEWLYPTLFEAARGATPGKRLMNIRVIQDDGTPLTFSSSIIRNFLRAVDFLPLFYTTGVVAMNNNDRFQRLGDLAAGSLVVYAAESAVIKNYEGESLAVPANLGVQDRKALVSFRERAASLSEARQIELANKLAPLTGHTGLKSVNIVNRWANWILHGQLKQPHATRGSQSVEQNTNADKFTDGSSSGKVTSDSHRSG